MERIKIREIDETTNQVTSSFVDTIYIPGFVNYSFLTGSDQQDIYNKPILCKNISEFYANFGSVAPTFEDAQQYPTYTSSIKYGFSADAIPSSTSDGGLVPMYPAGAVDLSFKLAEAYLNAGLRVVYTAMNSATNLNVDDEDAQDTSEISVKNAYYFLEKNAFNVSYNDGIANVLSNPICDLGEFDIKFITTGGYPTLDYYVNGVKNDLCDKMVALAALRGDCVALIDHTNNPQRPLYGEKSVYGTDGSTILNSDSNGSFGALFTPWVGVSSNQYPASYCYLLAYAEASKNNPNWLAIAGVKRGMVAVDLLTNNKLTNTIADSYQQDQSGISINAITNINGYGNCIWGNRTLAHRTLGGAGFATSTLNIRNLVSDVKKQVRIAALSCMFEQNNEVLWLNFKTLITPLLDQMVAGYGLKRYKIVKNSVMDKTKLSASVILYPENTVESFDISIRLTDDDAEVSE